MTPAQRTKNNGKIYLSVTHTVPYTAALSKNSLRGKGGTKGKQAWTYMRPEALKRQQELVELFSETNGKWFHNKLWVQIMVYPPNRSSDPINVLETIADALVKSIGLDDKWYSAIVDWGLDKENPRVEITVLQYEQDAFDSIVCSTCHSKKPATTEYFSRGGKSSNPGSLRNQCKTCSKTERDKKKELANG